MTRHFRGWVAVQGCSLSLSSRCRVYRTRQQNSLMSSKDLVRRSCSASYGATTDHSTSLLSYSYSRLSGNISRGSRDLEKTDSPISSTKCCIRARRRRYSVSSFSRKLKRSICPQRCSTAESLSWSMVSKLMNKAFRSALFRMRESLMKKISIMNSKLWPLMLSKSFGHKRLRKETRRGCKSFSSIRWPKILQQEFNPSWFGSSGSMSKCGAECFIEYCLKMNDYWCIYTKY